MNHRNGAAALSIPEPQTTTNTTTSQVPLSCNKSNLRNFISPKPIDELLAQPNTLMVLPYSSGTSTSGAPSCSPSKPGLIHSGLSSLANEVQSEVWTSEKPVLERARNGQCYWSKTESVIAAAIWLSPEQCQDLEASSEAAYCELLSLIQEQGYAHPFRFWNYIPDINRAAGSDGEHYKLFCTGRLKAFRHMGIPDEQFPSASALGHHAEGAAIYVLAARQQGQHYKNTLQVNAYQYPREYGVSSPSFSRATGIQLDGQDLFFISGTASIIGHQTISVGDVAGQLDTTISNIRHLLDSKAKSHNRAQLQSLKVYLRYASDLSVTKEKLEQAFPNTLIVYTLADVCRDNLLVEVEGFCG